MSANFYDQISMSTPISKNKQVSTVPQTATKQKTQAPKQQAKSASVFSGKKAAQTSAKGSVTASTNGERSMTLPSGRRIVVKNGKTHYYAQNGVELSSKYFEKQEGRISIHSSGRYSVTKNGVTRYYAANGKEINAAYFKQVTGQNPNAVKTSSKVTNTLNTLIRQGNAANKEFKKQLADDGWAADIADGVSVLWGSKNRASKVRVDIDNYNRNMQALKQAAAKGDEAFSAKFKQIYGVEYNQKAIDAYNANPTDANYAKAFGKKQVNIGKRVSEYNNSQKAGGEVVKTVAKVSAGIAVGVATGGTGFAALAVTAAATGVASAAIDETDRLNITDAVTKGKVKFREGTDHAKILKSAALDAGAVFVGGSAAKAAKGLVQGTKVLNAAGEAVEVLTTGQKFARAGITVGADVAYGMGQEYATTGEVTLSGTLTNAAMSGVGSAIEFGVPQALYKRVKRAFGAGGADNVPHQRFSTPTESLPRDLFDENGHLLAGGGGGNRPSLKDRIRNFFSRSGEVSDAGLMSHVDEGMRRDFSSNPGQKIPSAHVERALQHEPLIRDLGETFSLSRISSAVPEGEVCSIGSGAAKKLYVNQGGKAVELKMSSETFERLFPRTGFAMVEQNGLNNCWLVSRLNSMTGSSYGRAQLYQMIEETAAGDILVHLPGSKNPLRFPKGKPASGVKIQLGDNASSGVEMIHQAALTRSMKNSSRAVDDISRLSVSDLVGTVDDLAYGDFNSSKLLFGSQSSHAEGRAAMQSMLSDYTPGRDMGTLVWSAHERSLVDYNPQTRMVTYHDPYAGGVDFTCSIDDLPEGAHLFVKKAPSAEVHSSAARPQAHAAHTQTSGASTPQAASRVAPRTEHTSPQVPRSASQAQPSRTSTSSSTPSRSPVQQHSSVDAHSSSRVKSPTTHRFSGTSPVGNVRIAGNSYPVYQEGGKFFMLKDGKISEWHVLDRIEFTSPSASSQTHTSRTSSTPTASSSTPVQQHSSVDTHSSSHTQPTARHRFSGTSPVGNVKIAGNSYPVYQEGGKFFIFKDGKLSEWHVVNRIEFTSSSSQSAAPASGQSLQSRPDVSTSHQIVSRRTTIRYEGNVDITTAAGQRIQAACNGIPKADGSVNVLVNGKNFYIQIGSEVEVAPGVIMSTNKYGLVSVRYEAIAPK